MLSKKYVKVKEAPEFKVIFQRLNKIEFTNSNEINLKKFLFSYYINTRYYHKKSLLFIVLKWCPFDQVRLCGVQPAQ